MGKYKDFCRNMCKVSVVVPAYNAEKTIERTVKSVIAQEYINWELIVVDDGSKDKTETVVGKFNDKRIRYYKQINAGPGAARNRGIDLADGKYIMFLDSDDVIHNKCLRILVDLLESQKADISMCSYRKVVINSRKSDAINDSLLGEELSDNQLKELSAEECIRLMFYKKIAMPYPFLKLFRREVIGNIRFPEDIKLGEDLEFNLAVFRNITGKVVYTPNELYFYTQNKDSITHSLDYSVAYQHYKRLVAIENESSNDSIRVAVKNRLFVISYDYLSQTIRNMKSNELYLDCKKFIKDNKSVVLHDKSASAKVRIMALLSCASSSLTVWICKIARGCLHRKAI